MLSCVQLLQPHRLVCHVPLPMGFSRQEYWSGLPFPSPLRVIMIPYSGIQNVRVLRSTHTSALVTASLTTGPQGRHHCSHFTAAEAEAQRGEAKFRELTVIQQQAGAVAWPPVRALEVLSQGRACVVCSGAHPQTLAPGLPDPLRPQVDVLGHRR